MNQQEIIRLIQSGANPQQLVLQMLEEQASSNPMIANVLSLAKQNKMNDIEFIVQNLMKTKGLNYNKEVAVFKNIFNLK